MKLFERKTETLIQEDVAFVSYIVRKLCGLKTDETVAAKIQSLRASQAADTQRRLHDEAKEQENLAGEIRRKEARKELAKKHMARIRVHFRATATALSGNAQFQNIAEDMVVVCPECGKSMDISEQVMALAERLETRGNDITFALNNPGNFSSAAVIQNSIIRCKHYEIYNGQYCSTHIEVFVDGCRVLGEIERRA